MVPSLDDWNAWQMSLIRLIDAQINIALEFCHL